MLLKFLSVITTYRFQSIYSSFHLPNTDMTIICENWNGLVPISYTCMYLSNTVYKVYPSGMRHRMYVPQSNLHITWSFSSNFSPKHFIMMTSSNGNIFRLTGPLCGQFNGHRWIPLTKASDAELWCFLWSAWTNGGVNNPDAGDLRRHCSHYHVTVMLMAFLGIALW